MDLEWVNMAMKRKLQFWLVVCCLAIAAVVCLAPTVQMRTSSGVIGRVPYWTNGPYLSQTSNIAHDGTNTGFGIAVPTGMVHAHQGNTGLPNFLGSLNAAANTSIFYAEQLNAGGGGVVEGSLIRVENRGANPSFYASANGVAPIIFEADGDVGFGTNAANVKLLINGGLATTLSNKLAPTSITFPATTVPWTNTFAFNIQVYIDNAGVTGTEIKKNGTIIFQLFTGPVTIGLQPGEYFSQTFSAGTPTATFSPF